MERTKGPQKPSQIRRDASGRFASPDALVVEKFPASQQGAWTEAGKERRKAELERRRQQHKPLSLDAQAEIVTAVEYQPAQLVRNAHPWAERVPYEETIVPAPLTKSQDWEARDKQSERWTIPEGAPVVNQRGELVALWLAWYCLRAKGVI